VKGSLGLGPGMELPGCTTWLLSWSGEGSVKVLIGRHAVAVARLNCRPSAMVIHKSLGVNPLLRVRYLSKSKV